MRSESFRKGVKDGIPIGLGYFAVSFTFGMMAVADGLSIWQAVLISLTNVTSAGQFAGLEIMVMSGSYWEMALTQLIINLRYCLMSFSLAQKFRRDESLVHRYIAAFGVTDEIFGISASQPGKVSAFYNYGAMCVAIPGWVLGTLAGAISGNLLPDFMMSALSVAIYGMFLAIIIPPAKQNKAVLAVVVAAMLISTLFKVIPFLSEVSSGFVIIITTLIVAGAAAYFCPIEDEKEEEGVHESYILVMAAVTYLIRMLPLALSRKEITSPFIRSFLYYVPYACLAAMTFPAILFATDSVISAAVGFIVALIAAYKEKSLLTVALFACAAVFIVERILEFAV